MKAFETRMLMEMSPMDDIQERIMDWCPTKKNKTKVFLSEIDDLDLGMVKVKLTTPEQKGGNGWTQEETDEAVKLYKMFLKLIVLCPQAIIIPNEEIDEVWHNHILFTFRYAGDCEKCIGRFVHHQPKVADSETDFLQEHFANTKILFQEHFGVELKGDASRCACCSGGTCKSCSSWCMG